MNIVILDGYTANPGDVNWSGLEALGSLTVYDRTSPYELIERAKDAHILLTNKVAIGRDIFDILTRLRYVGILATGYSIVDTDYAKVLGIPVTNVPSYSTPSVSQQVFAFLLNYSNQVQVHADSVARGEWVNHQDFSYSLNSLRDLTGKTLGILGYGEIGRHVGAIARAFGMKVAVSRNTNGSAPRYFKEEENITLVPFDELAEVADFVSLHAPLNSDTAGIINARWLEKARGLYLINTARGGLIDEEAVLAAFETEKLRGYWADGYITEPPTQSSLLFAHPRVRITPHNAWASKEARQRLIDSATENVRAFIDGKPQNLVGNIL
ncbi:MAG: D-2-hydroxyacid dehydrogenase [Spirochaetales bacterium]|nr:D-2-hydroxyacid dehydrogenase [Spirochaetales bacterium]